MVKWRGAIASGSLGMARRMMAAMMLAVLVAATGAAAAAAERSRPSGPSPGDWTSTGRDWLEQHHSPLTDINRDNVAQLGLAWIYGATPRRGRMARGLEATPLIVDGVLYTSLAWSEVVALDGATGKELWRYDPKVDGSFDRKTCCDAVNRGVALADGRVYVGTLDGFLVSLDAKSGHELWRVDTLIDRTRSYTVSGAPQVAGDVVVIGNGGGEFGVRGYITAYDRETGAQRWRFFTVPGDPAKGYEHPELAEAAKTWDPKSSWESGGGGTAWDAMAYDPELGLLYVGTGKRVAIPELDSQPARR
jgi:quinohemoprotein ethanol dehydrogenase